jgi:hypothetical protein
MSEGVPTAVVNRPFLPRPALVEFRPALRSAEAPVVAWTCGSQPAPAGWAVAASREPAVPDMYLPSVCRQRIAR